MEEVVAPVLAARGIRLVARDVREDPELLRRYRNEIPVLLEGDVELARHRITAEALLEKLSESGNKPQRHRDTENGKRETD
jgi:Glutaredoxin-like domain (DUF836)